MNIISDIHGHFETFLALLKKMPDDEVLSVGDYIDRGANSNKVIDWLMKNGKAVLGDHESMMLDYYNETHYYQDGIWVYNGGGATIHSFGSGPSEEILNWLTHLPLYIDTGKFFISHSFLHRQYFNNKFEPIGLSDACNINRSWQLLDRTIIWNRSNPTRMKDRYQIAGHNSQIALKEFTDENGSFALCIDDSKKKMLTGYNTDTGQIYQQPYVPEY